MNYINCQKFLKISSWRIILTTLLLISSGSAIAAPTAINQGELFSSSINNNRPAVHHSITTDPLSDKISIDLVTVGDPGNFTSSKRHGAIPYIFCIGKYNVTADQYCAFLNAVAAMDTYGLYDEKMETDLSIPARIKRSGAPGSYTYSVVSGKKHSAIVYVSCLSAQRFCNWLENGQPSGLQKEGTTETGSYTLNGTMDTLFDANKNAQWRLPNNDEWFKAAYYKGGGVEAGYWHESRLVGTYGTYNMTGHIAQWCTGTKSSPTHKIHLTYDDDSRNCRNADYRTNLTGFRVIGPGPAPELSQQDLRFQCLRLNFSK